MTPLSLQHVDRLDELLADGAASSAAFQRAVGGTFVCDGFWRFFSDSWPQGGISACNGTSSWRTHWLPVLPPGLFSFGEDLFGNQLVLVSGCDHALLWNHENGECHDLFVGPSELLKTALESGIDWIDFCSEGYLPTARLYGTVWLDTHLHWTIPLILGGEVLPENVSVVERVTHLVGHAKLWSQVSGFSPGT